MARHVCLCCFKRTLFSCKFLFALFSLLFLRIRCVLVRGPPRVLKSLKPQQKDKNIKINKEVFLTNSLGICGD